MDYVLKPFEVSKYFTLCETLQWVENGLPPSDGNINAEYFYEIDSIIYDVFSHPRSFQTNPDCLFYEGNETLSDFDEYKAEYNSKNEIIKRLMEGKIQAYGHHLFLQKRRRKKWPFGSYDLEACEIYKCKNDDPINYVRVNKTLTINIDLNAAAIESEAWLRGDVDWLSSSLDLGEERYSNIFFHKTDVQREFPLAEGDASFVARRKNGYFIVASDFGDGGVVQKKRGRPTLIDWDYFFCQLARLKIMGNLPEKQEAAVQLMREWCIKHHGVSPGDSSLQSKISIFYRSMP